MVTLQTADNALKSFYLDAVSEQLNMKANPLLAQFQRTTADVIGKDVRKLVRVGFNGGVGAGTEDGELPSASATEYVQLVSTLKNLYGTIEISDKAIRSSTNNDGAFVNLLNNEMQSLINSASFNFGRMLFGDGSGTLGIVKSVGDNNTITLSNVNGIVEGMLVEFYDSMDERLEDAEVKKVLRVDRVNNKVVLSGSEINDDVVPNGSKMVIQGSFGNEITGLGALFGNDDIYGVSKNTTLMKPYATTVTTITEAAVQSAMDTIEEMSGSKVNFIVCSWGVKRALVAYCREHNIQLPTVEINGTKAIEFNGVPVVADRFCPKGTMYLLNTDDFKLHQLCDWQWLEGEDGKILKQIPGKPVYTATLVKYAELMCERPCGQGCISGITEA